MIKTFTYLLRGRTGIVRNTIIAFDPLPTRVEGKKCTFELKITPHGSQTVSVEISVEEVKPGQEPERPVKNPDQRINQIMRSYIAALECCDNIPTRLSPVYFYPLLSC